MATDAVVRAGSVSGTQRINIPSVVRSELTIVFMKLMLRVRGFGHTIRWIRKQVVGASATMVVDVEIVRRAEHAVALAGAWYPGRALCLEQSLALYYLLRRQGVPVKYCSGARPYPVWGSCLGRVLRRASQRRGGTRWLVHTDARSAAMRYFVCLLALQGQSVPSGVQRKYEALPRSRGWTFEWTVVGAGAVLTGGDAQERERLVANVGDGVAVGAVRLDNRPDLERWSEAPPGRLSDLELVGHTVHPPW